MMNENATIAIWSDLDRPLVKNLWCAEVAMNIVANFGVEAQPLSELEQVLCLRIPIQFNAHQGHRINLLLHAIGNCART